MKKLSLFLTMALVVSLLAGCAGTPVVYYTEIDCPEDAHTAATAPVEPTEPSEPVEDPSEQGNSMGILVVVLIVAVGGGSSKDLMTLLGIFCQCAGAGFFDIVGMGANC